jgi:hypothetical protein
MISLCWALDQHQLKFQIVQVEKTQQMSMREIRGTIFV